MKSRMLAVLALVLVAAPSMAAEYKVDPVHSSALFKVRHLGVSYIYGHFTQFEGVISFDENNTGANAVEITVTTASLTTHNASRDRHLSSQDFFSVKEFPVMSFKSTAWEKTGANTYDVTGDFSLLGTTKTITVSIEHVGTGKHPRTGKELAGFHSVFTLDRSQFGMNYGIAPGGGGLGKDVEIIFSVESIRQ